VNSGKLAPHEWRIPTREDWKELENYLIEYGYNWDSTTTENKIGKSVAATTDWKDIATEEGDVANNILTNKRSLFSAIPSGVRSVDGIYYLQNHYEFWWTSSELNDSLAYARYLVSFRENLNMEFCKKSYGYSVRLI
jgi:uncharacterized protein (TIGR02145 family)